MAGTKKGRVVVAMRGGVDSSLAAALLKAEGYEVIGLTMHLWDPTEDGLGTFGRCCSPTDIQDARRVADQIGIPHYVINLRKAFEETVVDYFVGEYQKCRTPNPCIRCNDQIKFGFLLKKTEELGAQALATGHYARLAFDRGRGRNLLLRGKDRQKDQSYFLFSLTQEPLGKILFPLGEKTKEVVRKEALEKGLRVAAKKESQEICFIPDGNYRQFVEKRIGEKVGESGSIVDRQGKVLGKHQGLYSYTIGQRRGLGLPGPEPHYVLGLDGERNLLIAGRKEELLANGLVAEELNWISFPKLPGKMEALVQIRYRHPGVQATLSPLGEGMVQVEFKVPQKSVTPGQAAVFYQGDEVLGGGWIARAL
ncbi:MAG: tRNA 2-thiouridine(34) synthase MnmA [Deltaproteobacteria bacterium]|nr:tRNA 2-thiouridine(34) synthase MnmA [Deltaproteobacteria bacterium]